MMLLALLVAAWAGESEPAEVQVFTRTFGNHIQCDDGTALRFDVATSFDVTSGSSCQVRFPNGEAAFKVVESSVFACYDETQDCVRTDAQAKREPDALLGASAYSSPAPRPPLSPELQVMKNAWDIEIARLKMPDSATAAVLSGTVGFGSGHYYAGSGETGDAHLMLQGVGVILAGVGGALALDGLSNTNPDRGGINTLKVGTSMFTLGVSTTTISRLVEAFTAPRKAREKAVEEMQRHRSRAGL